MPSRRDFAVLGLVVLALLAVYVAEGLVARGIYNDDDIGHYLMARDALARPELLLNVWGRPLFTLLYALPAQSGFPAVRLMTAVVTALAVAATGLAAARLGLSAPLTGALFGTMPFVLLLSYSSLTEPLCALVVALALWAWTSRRPGLALFLVGLVPLARLELGVIAGLCGLVWMAKNSGSRRLLGLLPLWGAAVWAALGALVHQSPLWLLEQVFTGEANLYGQTGFWHYPRGLIFIIGPVAFLFLLVDWVTSAAKRRLDWLSVLPAAVLLLYVVFSWKLSLGHAAGFLRHLVAPAPLFALAAGRGVKTALGGSDAARRAFPIVLAGGFLIAAFLSRALVMHHRAEGPFELARITAAALVLVVLAWVGWGKRASTVPDGRRGYHSKRSKARDQVRGRPGIALAGAVLVAIAFLYAVTAEPPLAPSPEQEAVMALGTWFLESEWADAPVIASHPWFLRELARAGRLPRGGVPLVKKDAIEEAAPRTVVIWDSHYSIRPPQGMQLKDFKLDPRFRMVRESIASDRRFTAYALLKEQAGDPRRAPGYDSENEPVSRGDREPTR